VWQNRAVRLFIAIELPLELRKKLYRAGCEIAESVPSVRPVKPEAIHLTLHFLGEIADDLVPILSGMITEVAGSQGQFTTSIRGLGYFGRRSLPTVMWAGVEPAAGLLGLQKGLAAGLAGLSVPVDQREYHPHITVARVKPGRAVKSLPRLLEDKSDEEFGRIEVKSVSLMKSTLSSDGAFHEGLAAARLG